MASALGVESEDDDGAERGPPSSSGAGPGHAHLKRPLVNPLKLRTDAAAYPNGAWLRCAPRWACAFDAHPLGVHI